MTFLLFIPAAFVIAIAYSKLSDWYFHRDD